MMELTEAAIKKAKELLKAQKEKDSVEYVLRVGLKGGGCSGLTYAIGFDSEVRPTDKVIFQDEDLKVIVDLKSLLYLEDTVIDYDESMLGGGFKFINPKAKRTCGCGSSFTP